MEAAGAFVEADLRAAEAYAADEFAADLLRGVGDQAAVARLVDRVTVLTGLDRELVRRTAGRVDPSLFASELVADERRRLSLYDGGVAAPDPFPEHRSERERDPLLEALTAPLTTAMLELYRTRLDWTPDRTYVLLNGGVARSWDWGGGVGQPEAVSALRRVLARDPALEVLVAHGYADLVTPYFASELILRQAFGAEERVSRATYRGGHMFYLGDASRGQLREDAQFLYVDE
jgi:carboxypeptidase C (cathepsin A)